MEKGKEMEGKIQAPRELTNKDWTGGRELELEPKPTGTKRRDFLLLLTFLVFCFIATE